MGLINQNASAYYNNTTGYGNYQFVSLSTIIDQFIIAYTGEDKLIPRIKKTDVIYHASRAMQELSFDTFKSCKSQEITLPPSLQMILPQDYVNYTKISWVDSSGIKHPLYPTNRTSNPSNPMQNVDGDFKLTAIGDLVSGSSTVTLDGEYKDITVGMVVLGSYIPPSTIVDSVSNLNGVTTITLFSINSGVSAVPLIPNTLTNIGNLDTTLLFVYPSSSLNLEKESSHIVENLSWNINDYKITGTASELTNIEVGMFVSHDNFPIGTIVENVSNTTIVVSNLPDTAVASGGEITFISPNSQSDTWSSYKSATSSENNNDNYQSDAYWPMDGSRFGLDPQHAQANGSFYIDCNSGEIHFSSNVSGKTVVLDYLSDSLGTDGEMKVHKLAEEAMYKSIIYAVLSTKANIQEYIVRRYKKERFAAIRTAKLRLSNIKLEEITQILRGKSKQIKH